ncbi:acyl carrier protein [Arenibacter algicola]|uniref:D-alanine--poly(Phosphoribitol) ligase subunit 2 n=1 Tax=Arenibacter algicola TaxID=616991 RepID=A0A221UZ67_9FLAO|nr:acyl carrier protein [Arenibacter algicola]ASO06657.1 D-alanine--poly(phosphoribitol) ligase subunit 2 [Arenibacter algicola]
MERTKDNIYTILNNIKPEVEFDQSNNFVLEGLLDSFDIVTLVAALDEEFEISIEGTDITPTNLATIEGIISLLAKYGISP